MAVSDSPRSNLPWFHSRNAIPPWNTWQLSVAAFDTNDIKMWMIWQFQPLRWKMEQDHGGLWTRGQSLCGRADLQLWHWRISPGQWLPGEFHSRQPNLLRISWFILVIKSWFVIWVVPAAFLMLFVSLKHFCGCLWVGRAGARADLCSLEVQETFLELCLCSLCRYLLPDPLWNAELGRTCCRKTLLYLLLIFFFFCDLVAGSKWRSCLVFPVWKGDVSASTPWILLCPL